MPRPQRPIRPLALERAAPSLRRRRSPADDAHARRPAGARGRPAAGRNSCAAPGWRRRARSRRRRGRADPASARPRPAGAGETAAEGASGTTSMRSRGMPSSRTISPAVKAEIATKRVAWAMLPGRRRSIQAARRPGWKSRSHPPGEIVDRQHGHAVERARDEVRLVVDDRRRQRLAPPRSTAAAATRPAARRPRNPAKPPRDPASAALRAAAAVRLRLHRANPAAGRPRRRAAAGRRSRGAPAACGRSATSCGRRRSGGRAGCRRRAGRSAWWRSRESRSLRARETRLK